MNINEKLTRQFLNPSWKFAIGTALFIILILLSITLINADIEVFSGGDYSFASNSTTESVSSSSGISTSSISSEMSQEAQEIPEENIQTLPQEKTNGEMSATPNGALNIIPKKEEEVKMASSPVVLDIEKNQTEVRSLIQRIFDFFKNLFGV